MFNKAVKGSCYNVDIARQLEYMHFKRLKADLEFFVTKMTLESILLIQ